MQRTLELPSNTDAERNLIGLTLVDGRIPSGARDVSTTDFNNPHYRAVWSAFLELDADGREIEVFAAYQIFKRDSPPLADNFALTELSRTTAGMVSVNEKIFVEKIKDAATSRFLMRELYAQIENLSKGGANLGELKTKLDDLEIKADGRSSFASLAEILERDVSAALDDLQHGITGRISTGFANIDRNIGGGLSRSDVLVVAGLPGSGKSSLALQLAANIAKEGVPVAFASGEMPNKENALRLLSQSSKFVNLNSETRISGDDHSFLTQWSNALKVLPLYFDSKTSDLQSLSRSLHWLVHEKNIKALVIDYIQLFKLNQYDRTTRAERIAECSQEVKRIAMRYGLAVIAVAQFNREGAKAAKPSMHDLEGSGQLEKDASLIFIIDREEDSSNVDLRIVKGRNTGKTKISGSYTGYNLNFEF